MIMFCALFSSYLLYKSSAGLPVPDSIVPIEGISPLVISATSIDGLKFNDLEDALQQTVDENTPTSYSRMLTTPSSLAAVAIGLPFQVSLVISFSLLFRLCIMQPNNKVKFYSFNCHPNYASITKTKPVVLSAESQVIYPTLAPNNQKQVGVTVIDLARRSLKEVKLKEYANN